MYVRHLLVSRHQQSGESVTEYAQMLKALAKECTFGAVTSDEYRADLTRYSYNWPPLLASHSPKDSWKR